MKSTRLFSLILLSAAMALSAVSCNDNTSGKGFSGIPELNSLTTYPNGKPTFQSQDGVSTKLPRAKADEIPAKVNAFDSVFMDVRRFGGELHEMMVVKGGKVIYEKYDYGRRPDDLHVMWSASKTFTATAVGMAQDEGLLSIEDPVIKFFTKEELPAEPSEYLKEMKIKHLLTMSGGFEKDGIRDCSAEMDFDWAQRTLNTGFSFKPGTRFMYNSMETYLLSVIVSRVTSKTVADYLTGKLFKPLGINRWIWLLSPQGYNCGGWGMYMQLEDFAKMGQFFLQKGSWDGKQLVSSKWIEDAMSPQIMQYDTATATPEDIEKYATDEGRQGYGYQMWVCTHNAARLDGANAQLSIIIPDKDLVVTIFSHVNVGFVMRSIWKRVYDNL